MLRFLGFGLLLTLALGCSDGTESFTERAVFASDGAFFDLPWPNDLRRTADGFLDVSGFPPDRMAGLVDRYEEAITGTVQGYSVGTPVYFQFTSDLDENTLPADPQASVAADATVFLFDVERGERHPSTAAFVSEQTSYWPGHCLVVRPVHGGILRPSATYAAVVLRDVRTTAGQELGPSDEFQRLLSGTAPPATAAIYNPALEALETSGIPRNDVLTMSVFTTGDPTTELEVARDWLMEQQTPIPERWRLFRDHGEYIEVQGTYEAPLFQRGTAPYDGSGGDLAINADGSLEVQSTFDAWFSLSLPKTPMPAEGFPVILYAHGTGGDSRSYVGSFSETMTAAGFAVMGIDQPHHGERNPDDYSVELSSFNVGNPLAFRDNVRQAALDVVTQAKVAAILEVPTNLYRGGAHLDANRIHFFGHSQGGLNGSLFLAIDDQVSRGVLSGAGGHIGIALVDKVEPLDIPALVRVIIGVPRDEPLPYDHPAFALLETWMAPADPTNYGRRFFFEPREGFAPKAILQTEGTSDKYTPPRSMEALALAARIRPVAPTLRPIEGAAAFGLSPLSPPVTGADQNAVLLQYEGGHFVAFEQGALDTIAAFIGNTWDGRP